MCGIAGAIDGTAERATARVKRINDAQRHRGPDHSVVARVGTFTFGNTRLAIQDPGQSGNQPFVSADGRYHCVFNGEIYNHRRLAERYQLPVRTRCDGEVIPQLWARLGPAALRELRGMFAVALVDTAEDKLYLARDPFGIKPLYWRTLADGTVVFGSEIRPLVAESAGVSLDSAAIARYLRFGAMAPDQAPFREVTALAPNTYGMFGRDGRVTLRLIHPDGPLGGPPDADTASTSLGPELADSIELHLGADVPTALLLSAGVDSAAIAAVGRRLGRDLNCLTVAGYGPADESSRAAQTARHYGHHFQCVPAVLDDRDAARFFRAMQRPSIDGLNTYIVAKAVRAAGFKVALSGLGGDEVVGGYSHFRMLRYLSAISAVRGMPGIVSSAATRTLARAGVASEAKLTTLLSREGPQDGPALSVLHREVLPACLAAQLSGVAEAGCPVWPWHGAAHPRGSFGAMVSAEVGLYLEATLLPDADAFSMSSSVELRVPFVDSRVFAASLDAAGDRRSAPGKTAIVAALQDPYLRQLAAQPKRGFSVPMRQWLTTSLAPLVGAVDDPSAPVWSVLSREAAERAGLLPLRPGSRWSQAWILAALNAWLGTLGAR